MSTYHLKLSGCYVSSFTDRVEESGGKQSRRMREVVLEVPSEWGSWQSLTIPWVGPFPSASGELWSLTPLDVEITITKREE